MQKRIYFHEKSRLQYFRCIIRTRTVYRNIKIYVQFSLPFLFRPLLNYFFRLDISYAPKFKNPGKQTTSVSHRKIVHNEKTIRSPQMEINVMTFHDDSDV